MKTTTSTTTTSLFFLLAIAFSSCILLASAQDDGEDWYDPNADFTPDDIWSTPDSNMGYYLNCDNADKNYFTLQKIYRCADPYILSAQNVQIPNHLAGFVTDRCSHVQIMNMDYYGTIPRYSNTDPDLVTQPQGQWVAGYDGYPYIFAQTESAASSTATTATKDGEFFEDPYSGWGSYENCVATYVHDPAFRGPVNATDIERLIAFDILMIINYAGQYNGHLDERCKQILLPMFATYGHFPGNGVQDSFKARYDYIQHSYNQWYETFVAERFEYNCNWWY